MLRLQNESFFAAVSPVPIPNNPLRRNLLSQPLSQNTLFAGERPLCLQYKYPQVAIFGKNMASAWSLTTPQVGAWHREIQVN